MWHAGQVARPGEQPHPGYVRGPGRTGLVDGARHAHRLTPSNGLGLLVVRGWVAMVGVPSRSEAEAGPECCPPSGGPPRLRPVVPARLAPAPELLPVNLCRRPGDRLGPCWDVAPRLPPPASSALVTGTERVGPPACNTGVGFRACPMCHNCPGARSAPLGNYADNVSGLCAPRRAF